MGTAGPAGVDVVTEGRAAPALLRAASALRWNRPDLTATLAELVLEEASDVETWVVAAGWLLHGRAAVGDGRDTAVDLIDALDRWGADGIERMAGPGRRFRTELAGPIRRLGEPALARALLTDEDGTAGGPGLDTGPDTGPELELRADLLTELARDAVDGAAEGAEEALAVAERAWHAVGCAPGAASVVLLRATRHRRAGRLDLAADEATRALHMLNAGGRPGTGTSDHVTAAVTAEWIAALVEAGRVDTARDALPAARRLLATARPSRQVAGLRLAVARLTAIADGPDAVVAALAPAAQDAADSDVPELEAACRSMLGELHEGAGRLDAALAAVRAAMTAERRDRDRATRLRDRLAALPTSWTDRTRGSTSPSVVDDGSSRPGTPLTPLEQVFADPALGRHDETGRRARRRAAELLGGAPAGAGPDGRPEDDEPDRGRPDGVSATSRMEPSPLASAGWPVGSSLIGDALFRELIGDPDERHADERHAAESGAAGDGGRNGSGVDSSTVRWNRAAADDRPSSIADTVVLGIAENGSADADPGGRSVARTEPGEAGRHQRDAGSRDLPGAAGARAADTGTAGARRDGRFRDGAHARESARHGAPPVDGVPAAARPAREPDRSSADRPRRGGDDAVSGDRPGSSRTGVQAAVGRSHPSGSPPDLGQRDSRGGRATGGRETDDGPAVQEPSRAGPAAAGGASADPTVPGAPAGPHPRGARGRRPARDADGLGLGDLLAGALAAYRDL